jgi:hypothetical protein
MGSIFAAMWPSSLIRHVAERAGSVTGVGDRAFNASGASMEWVQFETLPDGHRLHLPQVSEDHPYSGRFAVTDMTCRRPDDTERLLFLDTSLAIAANGSRVTMPLVRPDGRRTATGSDMATALRLAEGFGMVIDTGGGHRYSISTVPW